jgi:hypothetical protein
LAPNFHNSLIDEAHSTWTSRRHFVNLPASQAIRASLLWKAGLSANCRRKRRGIGGQATAPHTLNDNRADQAVPHLPPRAGILKIKVKPNTLNGYQQYFKQWCDTEGVPAACFIARSTAKADLVDQIHAIFTTLYDWGFITDARLARGACRHLLRNSSPQEPFQHQPHDQPPLDRTIDRRVVILRDEYRQSWMEIGHRIGTTAETAHKRHIQLTGNAHPGRTRAKPSSSPYWQLRLQRDFNAMRRNGATQAEMAETLKLPPDHLHGADGQWHVAGNTNATPLTKSGRLIGSGVNVSIREHLRRRWVEP